MKAWMKRERLGAFNARESISYKMWSNPDVVFDMIDADGSGAASIKEMRNFNNSPIDGEILVAMFADMDEDGSGEISREEWRAIFYKAGFGGDASGAISGASAEGLQALLSLITPPKVANFSLLHHNRPMLRIHKPEERGVTLVQLADLWRHVMDRFAPEGWMDINGQLLQVDTISTLDVVRYVIKPFTEAYGCSYVERCARRKLRPSWVVIHWWGDSFRDLLLSIEQHARDHGISPEHSSYWIAALALDQNAPSVTDRLDLSDPERHAIPRALDAAVGALCHLDRQGVALRRSWWLYEAYLAIGADRPAAQAKVFDLYASHMHSTKRILPPKTYWASGLCEGYCMVDCRNSERNKTVREGCFPIHLLQAALEVSLQRSSSSAESDKKAILAALAGAPKGAPPPASHAAYDALNGIVCARIVVAGLRRVFDDEWYGPASGLATSCLEAISASQLTRIELHLSGCSELTADAAAAVASSLPSTIEAFSVQFNDVSTAAANALLVSLASLIASKSDTRYAGRTPRLQRLALISNAISAEGGAAIGNACKLGPPSFRSIDFGCPVPWVDNADAIAAAIVTPRAPREFSYYGQAGAGEQVGVINRSLRSADMALILASCTRSGSERLVSLDLSGNQLESASVAPLLNAISSGQLPNLKVINLSEQSPMPIEGSIKTQVLAAMKRNETDELKFGLASEPDFLVVPKDPKE